MLQKLKNRLRRKTYERAANYAKNSLSNITPAIRPIAFDYNHYCFMNVANHILTDENRVTMYNGRLKNGIYYSSRPTLVLAVDTKTQESFLHCLTQTEGINSMAFYDEVTYGWYAARFTYYRIEQIAGDLMQIDLNFCNARVDFLNQIGVPFWYRWFMSPSELL